MKDVSRQPAPVSHPCPLVHGNTLSNFSQSVSATLASAGIAHPGNITTSQASSYLKHIGFPIAKSTLEVLRCHSRGPKYKKIGSRVFYTKEWLDEYAQGVEVKIYDPSAG